MWVARDKDGYLSAYGQKPARGQTEWFSSDKYKVDEGFSIELGRMPLDTKLFPYLTWEDEPIEVSVYDKDKQIVMSKVAYSRTMKGKLVCK